MFLTDARELGAREVAPDALLVKLPKKKRKIKNQTNQKKIQKIERKSLWTLAVTSQCRIFSVLGGRVQVRPGLLRYSGCIPPIMCRTVRQRWTLW